MGQASNRWSWRWLCYLRKRTLQLSASQSQGICLANHERRRRQWVSRRVEWKRCWTLCQATYNHKSEEAHSPAHKEVPFKGTENRRHFTAAARVKSIIAEGNLSFPKRLFRWIILRRLQRVEAVTIIHHLVIRYIMLVERHCSRHWEEAKNLLRFEEWRGMLARQE